MEVAVQTPKLTLLAADTNFLLDLERGFEPALECVALLNRKFPGHIVFVSPTVIDELAWGAENWQGEDQNLAHCALVNLKAKWGFQPVDLIPAGHGIVEITASVLSGSGILPEEERNDAFVFAEAALLNTQILISSDRHLLEIDQTKVAEILKNRHLSPVIIARPKSICKMFGRGL